MWSPPATHADILAACIVFGVLLNSQLIFFFLFVGRFMGHAIQRIVVPYACANVLIAEGCCSSYIMFANVLQSY